MRQVRISLAQINVHVKPSWDTAPEIAFDGGGHLKPKIDIVPCSPSPPQSQYPFNFSRFSLYLTNRIGFAKNPNISKPKLNPILKESEPGGLGL